MKTVFISHSTKDKVIADSFVDIILHGGLSVPISDILHTSMDGTKITSGEDWRKVVRDGILNAKLSFLLISPFYKESEVCICEMGAVWMTTNKVLPFIIDPISYKTVGVIHAPNQVEKLLDEKSLDRIKDIVQSELKIANILIPSDRWTAKKNEFILKIKDHLRTNSYPLAMDRAKFDELIISQRDLQSTVTSLIKEKDELSSLIEKLKLAKDKSEVLKIMKANSPSTQFESFQELAENVKKALNKFDPLVVGIAFKSFTRKAVRINTELNEDILSGAIANDYIDEEEMEAKWDATKEMRGLRASLDKLSVFMLSDLNKEFFEAYEEEFEAEFELKNIKFWKEVLDTSVSFG